MHAKQRLTLVLLAVLFRLLPAAATNYYVNALSGDDSNTGDQTANPFRSLNKINSLMLQPGDHILFAVGQTFPGSLHLVNAAGNADHPIVISSYLPVDVSNTNTSDHVYSIDARNMANGIWLQNCRYIQVKHANIKADGYDGKAPADQKMRVGVLINATGANKSEHILLDSLNIHDIYFENKGYTRGHDEVKTANGTERYGWGIRLMATDAASAIIDVIIANCRIRDVSHTGIKLTGNNKNIYDIQIHNNDVAYTGGPGIQMSEVKKVHVHHNIVDHSGSNNDSRKWGRGSGLWTWGSSEVLIEKNRFTFANGPGDSAGAHIDFNCDNVVLQYNFSAWNAGGFCEILGNNYNCAYRYNISVNDGYRKKGENGAFQEGKVFWLSGYQGEKKPRKGPVNSYFYNNTIYVDSTITARIAIDGTSQGILIANNIFYIRGNSQYVLGDQYKADDGSRMLNGPVIFKNNLWFSKDAWPTNAVIHDSQPLLGDPGFAAGGGLSPEDYLPQNTELIHSTGISIERLPEDSKGLLEGLNPGRDIRGRIINGKPPMGAVLPE